MCAVCPGDYGDPCDDITCPCKSGQALFCYQGKCALYFTSPEIGFHVATTTTPLVYANHFGIIMGAVCSTSLCPLRGPAAPDSEGKCRRRRLLRCKLHRGRPAPEASHAGADCLGGCAHRGPRDGMLPSVVAKPCLDMHTSRQRSMCRAVPTQHHVTQCTGLGDKPCAAPGLVRCESSPAAVAWTTQPSSAPQSSLRPQCL